MSAEHIEELIKAEDEFNAAVKKFTLINEKHSVISSTFEEIMGLDEWTEENRADLFSSFCEHHIESDWTALFMTMFGYLVRTEKIKLSLDFPEHDPPIILKDEFKARFDKNATKELEDLDTRDHITIRFENGVDLDIES